MYIHWSDIHRSPMRLTFLPDGGKAMFWWSLLTRPGTSCDTITPIARFAAFHFASPERCLSVTQFAGFSGIGRRLELCPPGSPTLSFIGTLNRHWLAISASDGWVVKPGYLYITTSTMRRKIFSVQACASLGLGTTSSVAGCFKGQCGSHRLTFNECVCFDKTFLV